MEKLSKSAPNPGPARPAKKPSSGFTLIELLVVVAIIATLNFGLLISPAAADVAFAWGNNGNGDLGNGTYDANSSPLMVVSLNANVTATAAGEFSALAIQNGSIYGWGDNTHNTIAASPSGFLLTPVPVPGFTGPVSAIAACLDCSFAIQNSALYAWGDNQFGQLGQPSVTSALAPGLVSGMSGGVTAIAAGPDQALAIKNGAAYAWGGNFHGELGIGTIGNSLAPTLITSLSTGVTALAAGDESSMAIQNGAVFAWGLNTSGALGNGTFTSGVINVPGPVIGLTSGVTAIAAGYLYSLAIRNGVVYAWGTGPLGDPTVTSSAVPILVPGLPTDMVQVAAGSGCAYALSADGRLWDWGANDFGNLGLGNTTSYNTPQEVSPPAGFRFSSITSGADTQFAVALLAPVPEPGALGILATGILLLACRRLPRIPNPKTTRTGSRPLFIIQNP